MEELKIERVPGGAGEKERLKISGSATIAQAAAVRAALLAALEAADEVLVDLSELKQIDLAGLQLLCAAHQSAVGRGKALQVLDGDNQIFRDMASNSGFQRHVGCYRDNSRSCIWMGGEN